MCKVCSSVMLFYCSRHVLYTQSLATENNELFKQVKKRNWSLNFYITKLSAEHNESAFSNGHTWTLSTQHTLLTVFWLLVQTSKNILAFAFHKCLTLISWTPWVCPLCLGAGQAKMALWLQQLYICYLLSQLLASGKSGVEPPNHTGKTCIILCLRAQKWMLLYFL